VSDRARGSGVTAVKHEDRPTPWKVTVLRERAPAGFKIFGGLGGMLLLEELRRAANETMIGSAYPDAPIEVYSRAHARGAGDEAAAVFPYLALIRRELQEGVGLAIRKHIHKPRGLIEHDCVRSSGGELDSGTTAELREALRRPKLNEVAACA
jgi:4-hydroxy-tetrahydrodipicolinate synthase